MSKILIVGNGPSALENKYGKLIDSGDWDIVMRFNRWNKNDDGTEHNDYSEYIGTRCDYWMVSDLRTKLAIERKDDYSGVVIFCPKFKYNSDLFKQIEKEHSNIKFVPASYEDFRETTKEDLFEYASYNIDLFYRDYLEFCLDIKYDKKIDSEQSLKDIKNLVKKRG